MNVFKTLGILALLVATAVGAWTLARVTADTEVGEVAADPPPIAVPVEMRLLETAVIDRGTVSYADMFSVSFPAVASGSVITWSPAVGSTVSAGDVLVETSGRPIFALPGAIPMYRRFERGTAGADVVQFQEAMVALGLREDPPTGMYEAADEHAAAVLYLHAGYKPETQWTLPGAERLVNQWRSLNGGTLECPEPCDEEIADIRAQLVERYASARVQIPAGEIVFVPRLPRRVGAAPQIGESSETSVELTGEEMMTELALPATRAAALEAGMHAVVDLDDGAIETTAQVSEIRPGTGDQSGLWVVSVILDEPLPELIGRAARVRIPVTSSDRPVLAVPVAALAMAADGSTIVTILNGDGSTQRVLVRAGLVADGYVEVEPIDGSLSVDDYVIVGEQDG